MKTPDQTQFDKFLQGYFEALFFTEANPDNPELEHADRDDLAPCASAAIIRDCSTFYVRNYAMLLRATTEFPYTYDQAGRDFWFSRNGHGVGFWDRDLGAVGDALDEACKYQTCDVYRGDDGKVYVMTSYASK